MKHYSKTSRITFVICSSFPAITGGRESWLCNVVKRIHADYHITIICKRSPVAPSLYDIPSNVTLVKIMVLSSIPVLGKALLRSYLRVLDAFLFSINVFIYLIFCRLRREETYIAVGSLYEANSLRWLGKINKRFGYICSVHGKHADDSGNSYPLLRSTFKKMEYLNLFHASEIWSSGYDTTDYLKKLGFSSLLMKNGVDCYEFSKTKYQYIRPAFMNRNFIHVTMVATLRKIRGLETAIEASACVRRVVKDFRLTFVGKGGQERWQRLAEELEVSNHVVFAGERTDVADILHFTDIALTLCDERYGAGLSLSLLEAMASGKPIVAWDNAYYTQLLTHRENALLVPEHDPRALADAIVELIQNADLRERIGSIARRNALAYDWSEAVSDFKKYIREYIESDKNV